MDFDHHAPHSSSIDDVPLKLLFPKLKMRRRASKRIKEMESPTQNVGDSSESVHSKVQESLVPALENDVVENCKRDGYTGMQLNSKVAEKCSDMDPQTVETKDINLEGGTCKGVSSNTLKRMKKLDPIICPVSPLKTDLTQKIQKELEDNQMDYHDDIREEKPNKKIKTEKEENDVELKKPMIRISGQVKTIAGKVEAELFKPYGSTNKKYRRKAKSLVSNLKDHIDPELRSSVLSGKRTPENTCCVTAEQLASCALSSSRVNKDEELMHRSVVFNSDTNSERIVEEVHRNEFKEHIEMVDAPSEVLDGGSHLISRSQVKEKPSEVNEVASLSLGEDSIVVRDNCELASGCSEHACSTTSLEQILRVNEEKGGTADAPKLESKDDDRKRLPAIISLNEYIKSKKDQSNCSVKTDAIQYKKSREDQSNDSVKTDAVHMEVAVQEEKTIQENLNLKGRHDLVHEPSVVDAGPDGRRNINTSYRIAENHSKLVGSSGVKELRIGKDEKLWEGCLQLNAYVAVMALAFFKSGVKVRANNWSKFVEVKGRVRLDAFEKFLQELPLSRNRALMVISIRWKVGSSDAGLSGMQEIANSYMQGERVGFAELATGVDLYVCPPNATMINMLVKYGFIKNIEDINTKQDDLIGCVVWRRNYATSNVSPKIPEQYINAKKLALSGLLLDSPSRPGFSQWTSNGNDGPKIAVRPCLGTFSSNVNTQRSDKDESRLQITQSENQIDAFVAIAKAENEQSTTKEATSSLANVHGWISRGSDTGDLSPGFISQPDCSIPHNPQVSTRKAFVQLQAALPMAVTNSDLTKTLPGEFGSKASVVQNGKDVQNPVTHEDEDDDDDDLPEFDFRVVSGGSQKPESQLLPSCTDVQSLPLHQFPALPSMTACNLGPLPPPVSLMSSQCQLGGHKNTRQVPQPPKNPQPSLQISDLIQKFGQTEATVHLLPVENCMHKVPGPKIFVTSGPQPAVSNLPHVSPNSRTPCPPRNEIRKSLWDDDDDMPEWCPPYLEQQDNSGPSVIPLAQPPSAMPKQPSLQYQQLGMQKFVANSQKVHSLPPQGPSTPQLLPSLRGLPHQVPNLPWGPPPPLPRGPPPSHDMIPPILRPVTKRDLVNMDTSNSQSTLIPQPNIRPPYCKPDFTPLKPLDGSARRF